MENDDRLGSNNYNNVVEFLTINIICKTKIPKKGTSLRRIQKSLNSNL